MVTVLAVDSYKSNAELVEACVTLGYLRAEWRTLDATYGHGVFWRNWRPCDLTACDLEPSKSPIGFSVDFRRMPFITREFDAVVFDPPYKLNGTSRPQDAATDERYGVHVTSRWQDRMQLCCDGIVECARVARTMLLVKCQDQVCSGKVRWQSRLFAEVAEQHGFGLVDRLDFLSYRPQPHGTRQVTARRNSSQLLVFRRGHEWRPSEQPVTHHEQAAELLNLLAGTDPSGRDVIDDGSWKGDR